MKTKKKLIVISILLSLIMIIMMTAIACDDSDDGGKVDIPDGAEEYVFEAEWSEGIEFMSGFDYSGTISGLDMIQKDYYKKGASNDYYVTGLYGEGLELEYEINSDKKVEDAIFVVRLSAEYMDISLTSTTYKISVNGNDIAYKTIKLNNVPVSERANMLEFKDFTLTSKLTLEEGKNIITFTTSNSNPMTGTMYATAPLIDCFKITTTAGLTWEPCKSNTGQ